MHTYIYIPEEYVSFIHILYSYIQRTYTYAYVYEKREGERERKRETKGNGRKEETVAVTRASLVSWTLATLVIPPSPALPSSSLS